jgi:predicted nucleic-acid-binding protein
LIALDTNVLVRLVTADDEAQLRAARAAVEGQALWISKTVLLEVEWVLRGAYGLSREVVHGALVKAAGTTHVTIEDAPSVTQALSWMAGGMDFADALHLASASRADTFVTFDKALARQTQRQAPGTDVRLLEA